MARAALRAGVPEGKRGNSIARDNRVYRGNNPLNRKTEVATRRAIRPKAALPPCSQSGLQLSDGRLPAAISGDYLQDWRLAGSNRQPRQE
jgi:hypothetical protein